MRDELLKSAVSAVTVGVIQAGIEITREQDATKAQAIEAWLNQLAQSYRVLAATALTHGMKTLGSQRSES